MNYYMSPELIENLKNNKDYDLENIEKSNLYSFGIIIL